MGNIGRMKKQLICPLTALFIGLGNLGRWF